MWFSRGRNDLFDTLPLAGGSDAVAAGEGKVVKRIWTVGLASLVSQCETAVVLR